MRAFAHKGLAGGAENGYNHGHIALVECVAHSCALRAMVQSKPPPRPSLALYLSEFIEKRRGLFSKILRRYAMSKVDIEDITQEAVLRALEAQQNATIEHPQQFLISVAKNVAREELRKRSRMTLGTIEDCDIENHSSDEPSTEAVLDGREKLRLFATAVARLPAQCRTVFVLKHVYGASHKEIGRRLGISVSTVEKHVAHGLKTCREQILEKLSDPASGEKVQYLFNTRGVEPKQRSLE